MTTSIAQITSNNYSLSEPLRLKARQAGKIREIGCALLRLGIHTLDEQAKVLDLPRSTTWTILHGSHKASGLSAGVINSMLAAPQLPEPVRAKVIEYIEEKSSGVYGHGQTQLSRFLKTVSYEPANGLTARDGAGANENHAKTELTRRTLRRA